MNNCIDGSDERRCRGNGQVDGTKGALVLEILFGVLIPFIVIVIVGTVCLVLCCSGKRRGLREVQPADDIYYRQNSNPTSGNIPLPATFCHPTIRTPLPTAPHHLTTSMPPPYRLTTIEAGVTSERCSPPPYPAVENQFNKPCPATEHQSNEAPPSYSEAVQENELSP